MQCSMSAHLQALGFVLEKTASDLLALQLLSMTQGEVQPELFDQWLHIMALSQSQNQLNWSVASDHVIIIKEGVRNGGIGCCANDRNYLTVGGSIIQLSILLLLCFVFWFIWSWILLHFSPMDVENLVQINVKQLSSSLLFFLSYQHEQHTANLISKYIANFSIFWDHAG